MNSTVNPIGTTSRSQRLLLRLLVQVVFWLPGAAEGNGERADAPDDDDDADADDQRKEEDEVSRDRNYPS